MTNSRDLGMPNIPLNQIYYGPPGTGKTYHTIQMSLEILGIELAGKTRQEIKEIFDRKLNEGRIVFTTFHQSLSYEDFIEGIKPFTRDGQISYSVEPGIFKAICDKINKSGITESPYLTSKYIKPNFSKIYPVYLSKLNEILLDPLCVEPFYFKSRKTKVRLLKIEDSSLVVQEEKTGITETISAEKIERIYDKFNEPEEIRNIVIQLSGDGDVSIEWTTADFAVFISLKEYEATKKIQYKRNTNNEKDHYVLIIDEINRGNVSQIFGELITLLEEDKRIGKSEAIRVTLPYSKEKFGVPSNLYVIGTMNTADRSIEVLDTAIRRRFHFLEMPSNPDLLSDEGLLGADGKMVSISLKKLLTVINERIEMLLDKDHLIGHSYFFGIQTTEELKIIFQNKIIPLIQEYFFGDLGKIGLILGDHFLESSTVEAVVRFAKFRDYDTSSLEDRTLYRLVRLSNMDLSTFEKAVLSIFVSDE
jgi:5-methylcytosine-specific restriction enzyme B